MAQFDIHENPNPATRPRFPFLVDIQSDLLADFGIRVVIPLTPLGLLGVAVSRLNPEFAVEGKRCALATTHIAGVRKAALGRRIGSLAESRDAVVAAIDVLLAGV
jgi:toxin CcdB